MQPIKEFVLAPGGKETLAVSGAVTIVTVTRILEESLDWFKGGDTTPGTIDLAGVTNTDSAGLALMIEWTRMARSRNKPVKFINTPAQMLPLARLFGVDHLLH